MAKKKAPVREYNFPDAVLVTLATQKASFLQRDLADLTPFGITAAKVLDFRSEILAFSALRNDEEELGDQTAATADKNAKADLVREEVRNMRARMARKFGMGSSAYRKLKPDDLSLLDDANLLKLSYRAVRVGNEFLTDLETEGLTEAILEAHSTLNTAFMEALEEQGDEIADRDEKQRQRVLAGNALYQTMMTYCTYGQRTYYTVNEAKHNDYIVYNTVSGQAPEEEPVPEP
jgi:hypothetical protein